MSFHLLPLLMLKSAPYLTWWWRSLTDAVSKTVFLVLILYNLTPAVPRYYKKWVAFGCAGKLVLDPVCVGTFVTVTLRSWKILCKNQVWKLCHRYTRQYLYAGVQLVLFGKRFPSNDIHTPLWLHTVWTEITWTCGFFCTISCLSVSRKWCRKFN